MTEPADPDGESTQRGTLGGGVDPAALHALMTDRGPRLEMGRTLGRGGMAVVREARQRALHRDVAVKCTEETAEDAARDALVREAWIAGSLEHPNIVPVYDIEIVDGEPHVVMKKIDGSPWSEFISSPRRVAQYFSGADPLVWHLGVLLTVCHAVEYAHSRGVLHRDLKPANVMIGEFGQVYVVDWGVAIRLGDLPSTPKSDTAPGAHTPSGTLAYLAPEMVDGTLLSPASDVYLLGGILYRLVSGHPPHQGKTRPQLLASVHRPVPVDAAWPLAALMERALALDPSDRLQSVGQFRAAIEDHLDHRGSQMLARSAQVELEGLQQQLANPDRDAVAHRLGVYDTFGACRFGFSEALSTWPESESALAGLSEALECMASFELDQGDDRAARLLLTQHPEPPSALVARVDEVRDRREAARHDLERLRADSDPRTAWFARAVVVVTIGGVWVLTPITTTVIGFEQSYAREVGIAGVTFLLSLVLMVVLGPWLVRSRLNRVIIVGMVMAPGLVCLLHLGCWLAGMDSYLAGTLELFVYFSMGVMCAFLAEWRILPGVLAFLLAFCLAMAYPGTTLWWMGLANLLMVLNALVVWIPAGLRNEMPEDVPLM